MGEGRRGYANPCQDISAIYEKKKAQKFNKRMEKLGRINTLLAAISPLRPPSPCFFGYTFPNNIFEETISERQIYESDNM